MENSTKILIVDDEAYIRRVVELKLKNKGYEVISAANGNEALEKFKSHNPEIVITDIKMPGMDGRALCEQIKKVEDNKPCLIIIVTCSVSDGNLQGIEKTDDTLVLEKPFSPSRILDIVNEFIENRNRPEKNQNT